MAIFGAGKGTTYYVLLLRTRWGDLEVRSPFTPHCHGGSNLAYQGLI